MIISTFLEHHHPISEKHGETILSWAFCNGRRLSVEISFICLSGSPISAAVKFTTQNEEEGNDFALACLKDKMLVWIDGTVYGLRPKTYRCNIGNSGYNVHYCYGFLIDLPGGQECA